MSEQAKRAAEEIYYRVWRDCVWSLPLYRDHSDKKMIQEIIDNEFAPIIQQRDELLEACKILASLNDETIEECTDHFGKTGSAVTVYQFNSVQYDTLVEALKKASAAIENATKEQK